MSFEKAWELLKMPIVQGSIVQADDDDSRYTGLFRDPETLEIIPITASMGTGLSHIEIKNQNERFPRSYASFENWGGGDQWNKDVYSSRGTLTETEYERRGYATALYNLMAYLLKDKPYSGELRSSDSDELSEEGKAFWQNAYDTGKLTQWGNWRDDLYEKSSELMKAFRHPELWHGTLAENAMKIMDEGLEPYSFGAEDMEEAERYADDRMEDHAKSPAILGFDVPEGHTWLRTQDEGYDLGTEYGHHLIREAIPPEYIRPFAIGHEGMTGREWSDFLRMLEHFDYLDSFYRRYMDQDAWRRGQ